VCDGAVWLEDRWFSCFRCVDWWVFFGISYSVFTLCWAMMCVIWCLVSWGGAFICLRCECYFGLVLTGSGSVCFIEVLRSRVGCNPGGTYFICVWFVDM
jgi:hypothetical protein